jgi:predicted nucleic acid-binding protein
VSASFILDCSLTMAWCFPDEATAATAGVQDRLEHETALVPAHWYLEVANVLTVAEKRKRITPAQAAEFLDHLTTLDIEADAESPARAFTHLPPLCRRYGLSSYDAAYLDLAIRRGLPLATLDDDLRAAARKAGVDVLGK